MEIKGKHKHKHNQKQKLTVPPRPPRRMLLNWCTAAASAMIANFPPNPLYAKSPATIPKTHCSLTKKPKKTHSQTPNTTTTSHHHIPKFNLQPSHGPNIAFSRSKQRQVTRIHMQLRMWLQPESVGLRWVRCEEKRVEELQTLAPPSQGSGPVPLSVLAVNPGPLGTY